MAVLANSTRPRAKMLKTAKTKSKDDKKLLLVAQEIKLAKILAGNNKKLRDKTLKRLKKWFVARESSLPFNEEDFMRIWKGLFYYMWMSDKPLVQEECAENISRLCHFESDVTSLLFFKCFLQTMCQEWFGIDFLRLDKFLMLVRRVMRRAFEVLLRSDWSPDLLGYFQEILNDTVCKVDSSSPLGLNMHISDIYLEELAKVCKGKLTTESLVSLLKPFALQLASTTDNRQADNITKNVFRYLMEQSHLGVDNKDKFNAWREQGFPGGSIKSMTKIETDDKRQHSDDEALSDLDEPKDPRAGKVDVYLPQLKFDGKLIADMLLDLRFQPATCTASRKKLNRLADEFQAIERGKYPLGVKRITILADDGYSTKVKDSVQRLQNMEQGFVGQGKRAKAKQLKKRKMKVMVREELKKYREQYREAFEKQLRQQKEAGGDAPSETLDEFIARSEANLGGGLSEVTGPPEVNVVDRGPKPKKGRQSGATETSTPQPKRRKSMSNATAIDVPIAREQSTRNRRLSEPTTQINKRKSVDPSEVSASKKGRAAPRASGSWQIDDLPVEYVETDPQTANSTPEPVKSVRKRRSEPLFKSEWEEPLKEGETEIFVPSRLFVDKVKAQAAVTKQSPAKLMKKVTSKALGKRKSQDALVRNPFSTPKSGKKVEIKEVIHFEERDYHKRILNSPGIPYDANKKPTKSLLKPNAVPSPINPFYKRKMKL